MKSIKINCYSKIIHHNFLKNFLLKYNSILYYTFNIICWHIHNAIFHFNYRTEFTLDESGDVTWKVPENTEPMPFFNCETYEVSTFHVPQVDSVKLYFINN